MDDFVLQRRVPVFDAHFNKAFGIDFDDKKLQEIVQKAELKFRDTGVVVPISDGHTSDDLPEGPPILGFANNFSVGTIGKLKPRSCIYCDFHIKQDSLMRFKELSPDGTIPRRSIELWVEDLTIDPIAILGGIRPARDLGGEKISETLNKNGKQVYRYSYAYAGETMSEEEVVRTCLNQLQNTAEFAYIRECMNNSQNEALKMEQDTLKKEEAIQAKEEGKAEHEDSNQPEHPKLKMQYEQIQRKYTKLEAENESLKNDQKLMFAKFAEIENRERIATRKADLLNLEQQGYDFDMADELEFVADLEPVRFAKHLEKIIKNYKKAPVGVRLTVASPPSGSGELTCSADVYAKLKDKYLPMVNTVDKIPDNY
jgi:hypothetical protein